MADDATDDPAPDPDAELIAYLDGELDGEAAREVEARLALDPSARAKADAYKKTFDLLDYLPKKEPSPDFATRTLTRLQPVAAGPASTTGFTFSGPLPAPRRLPLWVWAVAAVVAAVGGYAAHAALRPYLDPPARFDLDDWRVVERLPLYLGVDDLDYLRDLDAPDLFAPEVSPAPAPPDPAPAEASPASRERLIALFKSYPPARQQQLRDLDQQFRDLPAPEREHLSRVLEGYAVWLDRLSDDDRRSVLAAPSSDARLDKVRQVRERAWRESLPARQREQLKQVADDGERLRLVDAWKQAERARGEEWQLARRHWDDLSKGRTPWPFSDPELARGVDDYVKTVLRADPSARFEPKGELPAHCRLTRDELLELKARRSDAERSDAAREGSFSWFLYGLTVYRLSERHPYLPPFADREPLTEPSQLEGWSKPLLREMRQKGGLPAVEKRPANRGRWPEFALDVDAVARKAGVTPPPLGPSRPGEFPDPVRAFVTDALLPKLTPAESGGLSKLEGRWPEYPRAMLALARKRDLPVPGVTLPGPPSLWALRYSLTPPR